MKLETDLMKRFVEIIESDESLVNPLHNRHQVYRDMVYHRFYETITNIYPIFTSLFEDQLHELIRTFQSTGARSILMSDMAQEFGEFVNTHPLMQDKLYLADLLWLEWGEAELLLECCEMISAHFEWTRQYRLSDSARLRQLHYPIYRGDFEALGEYPTLLYYDFNENRVYFEEITPLGYDVLMLLQTYRSDEILSEISRVYKVDPKDLKEPLEELFKQWCEKKILTKAVQDVYSKRKIGNGAR